MTMGRYGDSRRRVTDMTMNMLNCQTISYCPRCASAELSWPTAKNFSCGKCAFVMFMNSAAAVAVIIECNSSILFGLRRHDPGKGMLDLPGGFVDQGESGEEALLREVREETGIELEQIQYLCSLPNSYHYRDLVYDTLDLIYFSRLTVFPQMQAADDLESLLWIDREAVDYERIAFPSLREGVRRYVQL